MTPTTGTVEVVRQEGGTGRCRATSPSCSRRTRCSRGTRCSRTSTSAWCSRACRGQNARRARNARSKRSGSRTSPQHYPGQLSGGMRQRAALARALSLETGILLMDEPFGALDEQTRMILGEDLSVLLSRTDKTIVFVTHSLGEAVFLADRVAVFSARPGTIKEIIHVDEPHPRKPDFVTSAKFTASAISSTGCCTTRSARPSPTPASPPPAGRGAMTPSSRERQGRLASRAVQATFLIVLIVLWYLATTRWRVSPLLLPNPLTVLARLLGHPADRRIHRRSARHAERARRRLCDRRDVGGDRRLPHQPLALSHPRVRAAVRRHLFDPDHPVPAALCPVLRARAGLQDRTRRDHQLLSDRAQHHRRLRLCRPGVRDRRARSMGASDCQLFRYVLLPAALPVILSGMRMGFTVALLSIIGSETIASLAGLGHRIVHLAEGMEMARMFAYIVFVVAIALILNTLVSALEARGQAMPDGDAPQCAVAARAAGDHGWRGSRSSRCCSASGRSPRAGSSTRCSSARPRACSRRCRPCSRLPGCRRALASHVLGARGRLCALGRDRARGRACGRLAAVRAQELHADHPAALRHAAGHHPAAVHPLFRHRPAVQDRIRRQPRHVPDHCRRSPPACRTSSRSCSRSARSMGASRWQVLRHVIFPHMIPSFFAGMRLGMTGVLLGVLLAELYVSTAGIGHFTTLFTQNFHPTRAARPDLGAGGRWPSCSMRSCAGPKSHFGRWHA